MTAEIGMAKDLNRKRLSAIFSIILFITCFIISAIIPPLQSPDEFSHIIRAYLLSNGRIILDKPEGQASGGMIDSGLAAYNKAYLDLPFKYDQKISQDILGSGHELRWTGIKEYSPAPGTGFYFPIIYIPQAVGLSAGEALGLTIDNSFRLARFASLTISCLIIYGAFLIFMPSPFAMSLLIIPMSLFQMSSASLDGISTAVAILVLSVFMRIATCKGEAKPWFILLLTVSVFIVASARMHLLPFVSLIFISYYYTKDKRCIFAGSLATFLLFLWLVMAIKNMVNFTPSTGIPPTGVITYYLANPFSLANVLFETITDPGLQQFYLKSFFGILGWTDAPFTQATYKVLYLLVTLIFLVSIPFRELRTELTMRASLALCAMGSVFLIFFSLLVTWTMHPASIIHGVQGRYFLVPGILIAYALSSTEYPLSNRFTLVGPILLAALFLFSVEKTANLLLDRYYIIDEHPELPKYSHKPSPPLTQDQPVILTMIDLQVSEPQPLNRIGIMIGTHIRKNPGVAALRLQTKDGYTLEIPFGLPDLADNQFRYFELDDRPYTTGEIIYVSGGGISAWEVHSDKGQFATCLVYAFSSGAQKYTKGCPRP